MTKVLSSSLLIALSAACGLQAGTRAVSMKFEAISVPEQVPGSSMLAHTPYRASGSVSIRHGLSTNIVAREAEYSWFWIQKAIKPHILADAAKEDMLFIARLGKREDDGVVLAWRWQNYRFEVVDSRILMVLARRRGLSDTDIGEAFKALINYDRGCSKRVLRVVVEDVQRLGAGRSYGIVVVERGASTGWFASPIEWYRDRDAVLFAFEKVLRPAPSKVPLRDPAKVVGGVPCDDARSLLRFEKSNRVELSREYFEERFGARQDVVPTDVNVRTWGSVGVPPE